MVQKVAVSREFEARLRHAATGKLSLSTQQKMGTFFELGKDKAAKGGIKDHSMIFFLISQ